MGASPNFRTRRNQGIEGINVTPMVDIMLVLLVIYIVASELGQGRVPVDLPAEPNAATGSPEPSISITLDPSGLIYWESQALSRSELSAKLQELAPEAKKRLVLHADRSISHGEVIELMGLLRASGIQDLQFATQAGANKP